MLTDSEENGGLDDEVDDAECFFFFGAEERDEKCCDPLRVKTDPHPDAVDVRIPLEGACFAV